MGIEMRPTEKSDYPDLSRILDDEWRFSLYSQEKALKLAEYYLVDCINGANVSVTMLVDGEPKGLLVLRDMEGDTIDASGDLAEVYSEVKDDPGFGGCQADIDNLHEIYERSAERNKSSDWAELRLLIVSKDCKGMGLGKKILNEARRIAESFGKVGVFFYTDTDCNFGFYDHMGAEKVSTDDTICAGEELTVYGYRWIFMNAP